MPQPFPDSHARICRLERRVMVLGIVFGAYVLVTFLIYFHDSNARRRVLATDSLFTGHVQIPHPDSWAKVAVNGGIAPSEDGKSISLWLARGVLQSLEDARNSSHQIRLDLDPAGDESLLFIDRTGHRRLQLALSPDGTPSITLLRTDGTVSWSTPADPH